MRSAPHTAAPTRASLSEAASGAKSGCRTREDFRRHLRKRRLRQLKPVMSGVEVAWALVVEPNTVYAAIRDGRLQAEREIYDRERGAWRWQVPREDVERLAAELGGAVTPAEERRVERMRIESFDGAAGEPR